MHTRTRIIASLLIILGILAATAAPAFANRREEALDWGLRRIGCPYIFGGAGPCHTRGFDCSGLVMAAYASVGIKLPRTTYEMLASPMLERVRDHPDPGNLVFFGDGHVTLYFWRHVVLQAPEPGENVQLTRWYPGSSWVPTGYYKIRDAGAGSLTGLAKWANAMIARYHLHVHKHTNLRDMP